MTNGLETSAPPRAKGLTRQPHTQPEKPPAVRPDTGNFALWTVRPTADLPAASPDPVCRPWTSRTRAGAKRPRGTRGAPSPVPLSQAMTQPRLRAAGTSARMSTARALHRARRPCPPRPQVPSQRDCPLASRDTPLRAS